MPIYDYRCTFCGPFSLTMSIREVTDTVTCPDCAEPATRVFSAPMLFTRTSPLRRALAAAEKSGSEPAVVRRNRPDRDPAPLTGKRSTLPRP